MLRYKLKFLLQKVTEVSDQGKKKKTAAFFQTKFISCYKKEQFSAISPFYMRLSMLSPLPKGI